VVLVEADPGGKRQVGAGVGYHEDTKSTKFRPPVPLRVLRAFV
jgi:hypothetical protein